MKAENLMSKIIEIKDKTRIVRGVDTSARQTAQTISCCGGITGARVSQLSKLSYQPSDSLKTKLNRLFA